LEIRDPIHGSIELTPSETAVVDSPFFQRLRNIKQMGFAEFSYPGATHNRYCHSLGAMHLAGLAFDQIFQGYSFQSPATKWRLRQTVRLSSLLHDIGHGPLSHTTEEVMPPVSDLKIKIYSKVENRKSNHEDYTLKIISDSQLTPVLEKSFTDLHPKYIVRLIDKKLEEDDDFFFDNGINFKPLLSQIVSSELDVDRMDYLARDSFYCGTSYGHVDSDWLIANLTYYKNNNQLNLALNRKALYTFDDFLISRYHMYLMVYFHHKGIIYDEMLLRYLKSKDCDFKLPSSMEEYLKFDDYRLHSHLNESKNLWAEMISQRTPFRMLFESDEQNSQEIPKLENALNSKNIEFIKASSTGRLSKYYGDDKNNSEGIFVVDKESPLSRKVARIEETTEIFVKYRNARKIERLYVSRDDYSDAQKILGASAF
jgi:HD superfamily phosphohydrolase